MTQSIIEITVSLTGEMTVRTKGFTGAECRQASQLLEEALGTVTAEQLTAEFYQQQQQPAPQRLNQE